MPDLETSPFAETLAKPGAMMAVPVGLASPLWALFAGAAIGGSAWWWMTRWARVENLEALYAAAAEGEPALDASVEAVVEAEPAVAAVEAAEAVVEPPVLDAPVGGEAAPIAPAVAAGEPKPRAKRAEPKPD